IPAEAGLRCRKCRLSFSRCCAIARGNKVPNTTHSVISFAVCACLVAVTGCKEESGISTTGTPAAQGQVTTSEVHTRDDGSRYSGSLLNGKKHGRGLYMWPNGDSYEGDWVEDVMSGEGVFKDAQGRMYKGQWANGLFNGKGT